MIVFCEDCGRKNTVGPDVIKEGKIDFYCSSCRYHNRYSHTRDRACEPSSQMTGFFDVLSSQKAIKGYFLFHPSKGILYHRMPSSLKLDDISVMGSALTQSYQVTGKVFRDIEDMKITLSRHDILIFHICNQIFFILIIDSSGFDGSFKKKLVDHLPLLKKIILSDNKFSSTPSAGSLR